MKEILYNMALIEAMKVCKENNLDCSGSHLAKPYRGYQYWLVKDEDKKVLVSVTLHKNQVPSYFMPTNLNYLS